MHPPWIGPSRPARRSAAQLSTHWHAILALGLALASLGCGATEAGTSASGGAGGAAAGTAGVGASGSSSGSSSAIAVPESCAEFGIDIRLGCQGCPDAPPSCECTDEFYMAGGARLLPERACTFGKCVSAVDCERVCQNFDEFSEALTDDVFALRDCTQVLDECNADADCGNGNLCIRGPGARLPEHGYGGLCSEPGHNCNEDADCLRGSRCIVFQMWPDPRTGEAIPSGYCGTGQDDQPCVVDGDCVTPYRCVNLNAETGGLVGECSTGVNDEPCVDDDDCVAPYQCVASRCSAGALDDRCGEASDCQSGFCVDEELLLGICTSGQYPDRCRGPEDCQDHCSIVVGSDNGVCVSGDLGSRCLHDADCDSALCGLNPNESEGICVDGTIGSPCSDESDCLESTCIAPVNTGSATCIDAQPGAPCEDGGVCIGPGECFKGKCG